MGRSRGVSDPHDGEYKWHLIYDAEMPQPLFILSSNVVNFCLFSFLLFVGVRMMVAKALVESYDIWNLIAALTYQLCVILICQLVFWGLSSFYCKMGLLG